MNQFTCSCTSPQCGSGRPRDEHETSQAVTLDSRDRTGRVRVRIVSRQGSSGKARSAARIVSARAIESSHPAHIMNHRTNGRDQPPERCWCCERTCSSQRSAGRSNTSQLIGTLLLHCVALITTKSKSKQANATHAPCLRSIASTSTHATVHGIIPSHARSTHTQPRMSTIRQTTIQNEHHGTWRQMVSQTVQITSRQGSLKTR